MKREWKPGDVVSHREFGKGVVVAHSCHSSGNLHVHGQSGLWDSLEEWVPLVVIDPEDREEVVRIARVNYDRIHKPGAFDALSYMSRGVFVDFMQAALREFANPTPPRPEEPTVRGSVVKDSSGLEWVRVHPGGKAWVNGYERWASWRDLLDVGVVEVVRS